MSSILDKVLAGVLRVALKVLYCPKIYYTGKSRQGLRITEPSIIVSNHTAHIDGGFVNTAFKNSAPIHALAAKDRFEQKWFGFLLRHTGCIPIDRQHADLSWIHESLRILKNDKENIAIYPEGRHGSHRKQLPFHPGVTMLAVTAGVPIIMVYLDGPHRAFHRTGMIVSEPFRIQANPAEKMSAEFIQKQTDELQKRMADLMNQYIAISSSDRKVQRQHLR